MNSIHKMGWLKTILLGRARDLTDKNLSHKISLIAVFAWVGLGADGLSSSCYGPEETFRALGTHTALTPILALVCMATVFIICASYRQIIELFPGGGGGYLVASKLLSPSAGVVSGCALLVDYTLTISISVASAMDALFSIFSSTWHPWKLPVAFFGILVLMLINLRGVRESVLLWVPIFFLFLATHGWAIFYGLMIRLTHIPELTTQTMHEVHTSHTQLGWMGMGFMLLRAYSVGAGTYTGIEAVSNGLPILREPRVKTGKRTMTYMGTSLAIMVGGLLISYMIWGVTPQEGKTLNAVLFDQVTNGWSPGLKQGFITTAMLSAMALLFIAAQAGFLDGPRVLASMAMDRWMPTRFATLSDRLVAQNGILLMGGGALLTLLLTRGSVAFLVVLYSINVFITFSLSQLGMVRYWWNQRKQIPSWKGKWMINGIGLTLTLFICISLIIVKFTEGGWITLVTTILLVGMAFMIKQHYTNTSRTLKRLDDLLPSTETSLRHTLPEIIPLCDPLAKTAVIFVNGFNGLGMHTLLNILRMFPGIFKNFVFIQVGAVDAGTFKGSAEIENLRKHVEEEAGRYVQYMRQRGFHAEGITDIACDPVEKAAGLVSKITDRFPHTMFFGGQLVFEQESLLTRLLHNFAVFVLQRELFRRGHPFLVVPIRV